MEKEIMEILREQLSANEKILCFKLLAAGLATIGVAGSGAGAGFLFGIFIFSISRNLSLKEPLMQPLLLGFALTEAIGLLAICMAFLLLFY